MPPSKRFNLISAPQVALSNEYRSRRLRRVPFARTPPATKLFTQMLKVMLASALYWSQAASAGNLTRDMRRFDKGRRTPDHRIRSTLMETYPMI